MDKLFGPDVCSKSEVPAGVFGMSHNELIKSEWVIDDMLIVKLKVEVRPTDVEVFAERQPTITVPPSKLADEFLLLLDSGIGSDVKFVVQGEEIRAHSHILSARSRVLQRQFDNGMEETHSKEVVIADCQPDVFKAFLRHLYSDGFDCLNCVARQKEKEPVDANISSS